MTHGCGPGRLGLAQRVIVNDSGSWPLIGLVGARGRNMPINQNKIMLQVSLWLPFGIISLLSLICTRVYWAWALIGHNYSPLIAMGIIAAALGIRILFYTGLRLWPTIGVIIGLIIGQSWLIEFIGAIFFWRFQGFAP